MKKIENEFKVEYKYPVYFTEGIFRKKNSLLKYIFKNIDSKGFYSKILFVIDNGVLSLHPALAEDIKAYFSELADITLCEEFITVPGGEIVKNSPHYMQEVMEALERNKLCRHSFLAVIGGGAALDMAGFAAAISHRGIRHLRFPTTVLSQNDSGVGFKNGINVFRKKNFAGTFAPPFAVVNDSSFLNTLSNRDWRSGIAEAVKVALIKDSSFFDFIDRNVQELNKRNMNVMNELIYRCAELHIKHISSGDPFEKGSSRPLDFGHWSAHKIEQLSRNKLRHGEAVAIGIALDATISWLSDLLSEREWIRIIGQIKRLGFRVFTPELLYTIKGKSEILKGLEEFREHLGGRLTIMLLKGIGQPVEVSGINQEYIVRSIEILKELEGSVQIEEFLKKNIL
jgi:3-dehydroquinate synthase